ncbi:hypothetical protein [Thermococcus sp. PK]|uniref:hypothetical protein n=1 Tax=Thermococcus sp. PK TaxID=913025 RepID=UPI0005B271AA|nr:hypothetical protein [Thermococcus sp. PK]
MNSCRGFWEFYADGAYDSKKVLNTVVEKGYRPIVKKTKNAPGGFGSKKRDRVFSEEEYRHRNPHEGFWGAFTTWFGSRIPCFLKKTNCNPNPAWGNVLWSENPPQSQILFK